MERIVYQDIIKWSKNKERKPLILNGARQVGKTWLLKELAKKEYAKTAYFVCRKNPLLKEVFTQDFNIDRILRSLRALSNVDITPEDTLIILDEVQDIPEAIEALKYFYQEAPTYHIAVAGSLLGVSLHKDVSFPVGKVDEINVYPLNFKEFLLAKGEIEAFKLLQNKDFTTTNLIHDKYIELLRQYYYVGGMPEVVNTFLETKNIECTYKVQRNLIAEYEEDMVKYADDADKPRIRECFESIPTQLAKDNKKFQFSIVRKGGRASQYIGSIQWLEDAGIAKKCYNTQITELPLEGNSIKDCFKLYTTDIGLLVAMLDYGTQADILKGNLLGYKGAIFENLMADFLCKSGQKLYYFQKESGLELDFLVRYNGECVALEVKAKSGKTKSLKTALKNKNVYHLNNAIKLGQYNVGREEEILTIPLYMGFLIKDRLTDLIVPDIDLTLLDRICSVQDT